MRGVPPLAPFDNGLQLPERAAPRLQSQHAFSPPALAARSRTLLPSGCPASAQKPPPPSAGRILLLPRTIVSGDRATLAVLDVNGRLSPGVAVSFSNGDRLTTDRTGRALFVAPLTPGVLFGSIAGHEGRVPVTILPPGETAAR